METVYSEFLEVLECGKVAQGAPVKTCRSEFITITIHADPESLDEWKQTKLV